MKYIITYSRFDNDLNVSENASQADLLQAYLIANGGPIGVINHFFKYLNIVPDFTEEAQIIEPNITNSIEHK